MEHPTRWDLPKGHLDPGETELECAVRELKEETGIRNSQLQIDHRFRFVLEYAVTIEKYQFQPQPKELVVFLALLTDPNAKIDVTEHAGYKWFDWDPPHHIQKETIDPLLAHVETHLSKHNR